MALIEVNVDSRVSASRASLFVAPTETSEWIRNNTGALGEAMACMAEVGILGCGFEQHLEAMRLVLGGERPGNARFLRDDALLVVVILGDEDDCSASDPTLFDPTSTAPLGFLPHRCTAEGVVCEGVALTAISSDA